ncbi:hypothetical protein [Hydrogenophaga borbori]|uniref:hypothetical protein n=1 Tax=Hydrogenophaga borbori TaxID=2294117 RepID=UPI00301D29BD
MRSSISTHFQRLGIELNTTFNKGGQYEQAHRQLMAWGHDAREANRPPQWRPIAASRSGVRAPSRHTVIGSPPGHDPGAPPPLTPRRPARDAAPGGSARDALLSGDPPLLVREASPGRPTRFRFTRSIDPATHHALIAAACAEWFASPAPQDPQEGLAFLDAVIDQADTPTLSHQLLDRHGDELLTLAPPPWDSGRLPAIATCLHALGHQLTRHTPAALRRLVLAFHPEAEVATALRELSATVQALEQAKAPLSANDAQQLVQRLYHLSRQALDLGSHALVRTAVDLAQRVANGAAPTGRANPAAVQALVNVMVQALPPGLSGVTTLRINDWLFLNIAWPPGPDGRRLLDVRVKQELIDRAPETARRELLQWAHEQQAQGTDALPWAELQALVDELMPCLHRPLSLEERLALCRDEALLRLNPQPLLNLLSSWLDGAPADAGLLHELLERYRRPDVPAERRLALLRGALPLLPHPFDDPRLHLAYRQLIDTLPDNDAARAALEQHEAAVRPQRAPPNAPSGYVRQRLQDRARHEAPPGPSGPAADDDPLPPPDEACAWFGPAFATSEADVGEALDRLFSGASAPLRHNFQHDTFELTVHRSDALLPHLSESDRAALLRTACQQLQLAAASNDARDDAARARVVAWLHEQAGRTGGLPLVAIHALWPALPWPLGPGEWLNLCLSDARQRGQPQALIDWLKAPPPDDHRFIDKELFQDVLDIAQSAPLNHGDRRRLLLAAQALLNEHLRDAPLQARFTDALDALRSPRKGGGGYPQAYQTLFQNSPRLFSPPGDERPDAFQLNQPVLSPGEVDALITVCDTWAQGMQMQKAQKLLDAVLRGTQDLSLHRRLLTLYADRLAALRPQAAQQTQWQGILSAIAGLARQGWATAGHTHETDAATRTVLRTLVRAIDWGQYAHIELSAIEHQIQHLPAPPLRGDTGRALLEQLTRLSLASIGKDDALVAQRTLRLARALVRRLGEDHELQAALKPLFTEVSQRWLDQARPALHPWFVLQRSTAPSSSPRAGQARLTYGWSGADKTLATPEQQANAWRALLQWVRIELENPQGPVWADMRALLELVESAWKRPLDDRQWLALCLLEVSRTGGLSSLNQRLAMQRARPLDEAMLRKLLALASEARFPTADRAALLRHLAQKLPPYEAHTALHEDFLRVLFRRFEPDTGKVLLRTYRDSLSPAGKGLVALVELVARLENEDYRSSESAWKRFGEAPHPDARVDWDHWRRLCGQLARSMAERIQRFQTASFPSADRQRFNTLVVQVLWRLSAQAKTRASTAIDRQFELLGDLVQALPEEHREAFLHQLDATCTQLIATALQPGDTAPAPPMPIPLLALQGAVRALATRRGDQVATPPATDRPSTVERAVQDFSDVFRAVRASRTGDLKALRNAHRSAQERGDFTSSPSSYPREVAGALIELLARHIDH